MNGDENQGTIEIPIRQYTELVQQIKFLGRLTNDHVQPPIMYEVNIVSDGPGWRFDPTPPNLVDGVQCKFSNNSGKDIKLEFFEDKDRKYKKQSVTDDKGNHANPVEIPSGGDVLLVFSSRGFDPMWVDGALRTNGGYEKPSGSGNGPNMGINNP